MGLSTKQVSSDGHGWHQALLQAGNLEPPKPSSNKKQPSQQHQQQHEALKCPRCDSTNTKFCYYNNYNKSQPRHFCKACKRHWTEGGTLRNVPVGGGRKNKRKTPNAGPKTASKITPASTSTTTTTTNFSPLSNNNISEILYRTISDGIFLGSNLSLPLVEQQTHFPYSNLASFESNPCSISSTISSIQSPHLYNFTGDQTVVSSTVMDMTAGNWGWDDFEADLGISWVESEIKPSFP